MYDVRIIKICTNTATDTVTNLDIRIHPKLLTTLLVNCVFCYGIGAWMAQKLGSFARTILIDYETLFPK